MKFIIGGLIAILVLFIYSACVVASRCSRLEEKIEEEEGFYCMKSQE